MENPTISITASRKIIKYAEGADPEVDAPIEVVELPPEIFTGQAAVDLLDQMGVMEGNKNGTD